MPAYSYVRIWHCILGDIFVMSCAICVFTVLVTLSSEHW